MATYRVQLNDTPASIAQRFTGSPAYAGQLIAANPQKARMVINGAQTWRSLRVGELINLPANWNVRGLAAPQGLGDPLSDGTAAALAALDPGSLCQAGNPTVTAFQTSWNAANPGATQLSVDGKYGPNTQAALLGVNGSAPAACTTYTSGGSTYTAADVVSFANAINADGTICNGTPNANVSNFQSAYNQIYGGTLAVDGKYGPATFGAMNSLVSAGTVSTAVQPCAIYSSGGGGGGGSGGGGIVVNPPPGGTTNITQTSAPASSATPWIVGALAIAGGVGAFYYLAKMNKQGPASHPMSHRLMAARRR